jgi:carbon monoxide dehydrogenase subunit G
VRRSGWASRRRACDRVTRSLSTGVESFTAIDDDTYEGAMKVKVGPIAVRLQGRVVVVERNRGELRSRLDMSAAEKRIASTVNAKLRRR